MLSIAVAGAVFASPPPSNILMALRHVTKTDSGELFIKKQFCLPIRYEIHSYSKKDIYLSGNP